MELLLKRVEGRGDEKTRKKIKHLLDDLKGNRRYWKLKEEALDRTRGELSLEKPVNLS